MLKNNVITRKSFNSKISVIIPVFNAETTIIRTLNSLLKQSWKIDELIIVNDNSTDNSLKIIKKYIKNNLINFKCKLFDNKITLGLAEAYNKGIRNTKADLIITLHCDVLLEKDAVKNLLKPFIFGNNIVAASHIVVHPFVFWRRYNFWGKVYFARLVGKEYIGIDGKFDCFKRSALKRIGYFDSENYRTAGEDGDIVYRLKRIGNIVDSSARIIHLHRIDRKFNYKDIIRKQMQYSESQGVNLRRKRITNFLDIGRAFFREILLLSLFVPYIRSIGICLIILYSFLYSKQVFLKAYNNYRIIVLPFFNIFLLLVSFVYSVKGILVGRQTK